MLFVQLYVITGVSPSGSVAVAMHSSKPELLEEAGVMLMEESTGSLFSIDTELTERAESPKESVTVAVQAMMSPGWALVTDKSREEPV